MTDGNISCLLISTCFRSCAWSTVATPVVNDFERLYLDIGPSYTQRLPIAATLQGKTEMFSPNKEIKAQRGGLQGLEEAALGVVLWHIRSGSVLIDSTHSKPREEQGTRDCAEVAGERNSGLTNAEQREMHKGINPLPGIEQRGLTSGPKTIYRAIQQSVSPTRKSIQVLCRATPVNAGLNLSPSFYSLTPAMGTQALSTGVYGPLLEGTVGLLLGRGSTIMQGILVASGVIDC